MKSPTPRLASFDQGTTACVNDAVVIRRWTRLPFANPAGSPDIGLVLVMCGPCAGSFRYGVFEDLPFTEQNLLAVSVMSD